MKSENSNMHEHKYICEQTHELRVSIKLIYIHEKESMILFYNLADNTIQQIRITAILVHINFIMPKVSLYCFTPNTPRIPNTPYSHQETH